MVKNDALFSYIAPSNIFAWLLMPLRFCIPLKHFVWLNRTIIKFTHFPVLFCIYLYERFWLAPSVYEPTDLVENPGRGRGRAVSFANPATRAAMLSPSLRIREESVAGFHKDRALEEVFRRAPDAVTLRTQRRHERRKTQTAIRNWMDQHDEDGVSPGRLVRWPSAESRAAPEWQRRMSAGLDKPSNLRQVSDVRSAASDPADMMSNPGNSARPRRFGPHLTPVTPDYKDHTDADGDDELVTNDEDEDDIGTNTGISRTGDPKEEDNEEEDYFTTPKTTRFGQLTSSYGSADKATTASQAQRSGMHSRTLSTNTILYRPDDKPNLKVQSTASSSFSPPKAQAKSKASSGRTTGGESPRRAAHAPEPKARPILPPRGLTDSGAVSRSALMSINPRRPARDARRLSSVDLSVMSEADAAEAGLPGSFQTQMAMAMMKDNHRQLRQSGGGDDAGDRDRMGRLVLARMKTLEEGFAEVIKEMRDMRTGSSTEAATRRNSSGEDLKALLYLGRGGKKKLRSGEVTPKRAGKRPVSRRSFKGGDGISAMTRMTMEARGKEKEKEHSSSDDDPEDNNFSKKGTSL